jgi:hypothetical protein
LLLYQTYFYGKKIARGFGGCGIPLAAFLSVHGTLRGGVRRRKAKKFLPRK